MARPRRNIAVTLTPEEWDRLVRIALENCRNPIQQARHLVRCGLEAADAPSDDPRVTEEPTADVA
jgi:hypothetical protein